MNASGGHLSKEFFELVKAIGESRSKQEEDRIILAEIITLKQRLNEAQVPNTKMREYLVRSLYIEMLGHDASFAYIHAVKLTHDKNLICKRIGYLTCTLCLDNKHELLLLLINTIQKDLSSSNHLEVAAALNCITKLINEEMSPAIFPAVLSLITDHSSELIRKKCCMVLHALYKVQPQLIISEARDATRRALCDPDPSVMGASLHLIHELARHDKEAWKDLVPSLVSILKQITEHRLPRDYDYHRIPAPWAQIKLLSLLATLGEGDQEASEQMQEVLVEVLRRAELGANVGFAIIYECVKTITSIYPSSRLLDLAATSISRFISADNHNLKYVGITGLASIVRVHPTFAAQPEHQIVVLDCLEDVDETLKRRTLELLFRMTNPVNAGAVVDKLLSHLRMSNDTDFRRDLVAKITRLADRFAPNHVWYVQTINSMFELGGTLVSEETAHNLLRLVAEGPTGTDEGDEAFRRQVVNEYIRLAERATALPDVLVKVAAWVIGEYGTLNGIDGYASLESLLLLLCECLERTYEDVTTRTWILSAIMKLSVLRLLAIISPTSSQQRSSPDLFNDQHFPLDDLINSASSTTDNSSTPQWPSYDDRVIPEVEEALGRFRYSESPDVELRCREFQKLILGPAPGSPMTTLHLLGELFPFDGACEDITVDTQLSFLDDFISSSLASGARPYLPPSRRTSTITPTTDPSSTIAVAPSTSPQISSSGLKFTPYAAPQKPPPNALRQSTRPTDNPSTPSSSTIQPTSSSLSTNLSPDMQSTDNSASVFRVSGPRKWGPQGYQGMQQPPKPPIPSQSSVQSSTSPPSTSITPSPQPPGSAPLSEGPRPLTERELAARALFGGLTPSTSTVPISTQNGVSFNSDTRAGSILASRSRWGHVLQENRPAATTASSASSDVDGRSLQSGFNGLRRPSNNSRLPFGGSQNDLLDLGPTTSSTHQKSQTPNTNPTLNGRHHPIDNHDNLLADTDDPSNSVVNNPTPPSNDLILDAQPTSSISQFTSTPSSIPSKTPDLDLMSSLDGLQFSNDPIPNSSIPSSPTLPSLSSKLRPFPTTTSQVGSLWATLPIERRAVFPLHSSYNSIGALFKKLQALLNIATVELIGVEGIGAAQLIQQQPPIFIHAKLGVQRADMILRGSDDQVLQEIISLLELSLQQSP